VKRKNLYTLINFENFKPGRIYESVKDFVEFYLKLNNFCFLSYVDGEFQESELYDFSKNEFRKVQMTMVHKKINFKIND